MKSLDLFKNKDKVCISIAGSDSSGGAGIQADVKTFSMFNLSSATVITALTAQNSKGVQNIFVCPENFVLDQLNAVFADGNICGVKTGMLYSKEIIKLVSSFLSNARDQRFQDQDLPIVVDPVMTAEAGGRLISDEALMVLKDLMLPISSIVTPNIMEAEKISGVKINCEKEAEIAAKKIFDLGVKAVIVTGGHLNGTDIFYDGEIVRIKGDLVDGRTHGSGCTYSSLLLSLLVMGYTPLASAKIAKQFLERSIEVSRRIGEKGGSVNQTIWLLDYYDRYNTIEELKESFCNLISIKRLEIIIPEVGSNFGLSSHYPRSLDDIAAVEGRITKIDDNKVRHGCISFGASRHVARMILTANKYDKKVRSAINIKFSDDLLDICKNINFSMVEFDRKDEPPNRSTMEWGVAESIKKFGNNVPDVIYDQGGIGKEPMIRIFGESAYDVVEKIKKILENR
ncbi:MAG TPA: bifunctional hydroxymethylpyrimidine kinase/phosphomethylpyrimidine kinase [Halobacteria archaeon]|jgi:hydroxymethylpyrimidine/phosphomethylpyrimidine kinase|nr:bifunctional hydroxymethylpyrimidine kinase/phosphomethylpyrimidine kinase [Halobacteria archaeon]